MVSFYLSRGLAIAVSGFLFNMFIPCMKWSGGRSIVPSFTVTMKFELILLYTAPFGQSGPSLSEN